MPSPVEPQTEPPTIEARLRPRARPEGRPSGSQNWRDLLFLHWDVDIVALRALVPEQFELDLFEGRALVGAVPFAMERVRPWWLPAQFAFEFLETNLRTYVTHAGEPGVYFFSLEAASWLAVKAACIGWRLPYHHAEMHFDRGEVCRYRTDRRGGKTAGLAVQYRLGEALGTSQPGSVDFFLLERYLLFSLWRGRVLRGQVHHQPYPIQQVELEECSESLLAAEGIEAFRRDPTFVHFSPGVDVEVFGPHPVG